MFVLSSDAKLSEPKLYGHFYVIWSKQLSLPLLPFGFNPVTLLEAKRRKACPGDMVYNNGKVAHSHIQPPPARPARQPRQQSSHVSALLDHRVRLRKRDLCVGRVGRRTRVDEGVSRGTVKLYSYLVALGKKNILCVKTQVSVYNWLLVSIVGVIRSQIAVNTYVILLPPVVTYL